MESLTKAERLSGKESIEKLIKQGQTFSSAPFRVSWKIVEGSPAPVQVLISAPKKIFKRAVDRNRVKRLVREAYRKNKNILIDALHENRLNISLVYTAHTIGDYKLIENKITQILQRLVVLVNRES